MTKIHLYERGKGSAGASYYVLKWRGTKGQWQYESLGRTKKSGGRLTKSAAEQIRREKEIAIGGGQIGRDNPRKMTIAEFIDFHEQAESFGKRAATVREWRTAGNHAKTALGDVRIDQLTPADIGRIREHLQRSENNGDKKIRSRRDATIRKTLVTLRGMLNNAVRRGLIHRNPLAGEKLGPPPSRTRRIFSANEIDAMVIAAPSLWWKALIRLAYTTGLRKGELLNLRWVDLDDSAGAVHVQGRETSRFKVSDEVGEVAILSWDPKTRRSARTVPVPPDTLAQLLRLKMRSDGSPYVFLDCARLRELERKHGTGPVSSGQLVNNCSRDFNVIQKAAAKVRKDDNWRFGCLHDLRKSFGTRAAAAGVPMRELQSHMGHASITTTADFYTDVEESAAARLRNVFVA